MLIVGTDKSQIIEQLPDRFLLIDDGPLIEKLPPQKLRGTHINLSNDQFNPLQGMDYKRARDFISVIDAVFPEGDNTLTKKSSRFVLLNALLSGETRLSRLVHLNKNDPGSLDAHQKIETLLLSPVLKPFLTGRTNFSLDGVLIARLDRTVLSEFDCFVIANLLISRYPGTVIVPDFGFYGCAFHTKLIRQERLRAGVNYLDETPIKDILLIKDKRASGCTPKDAKVLADFAGLIEGRNEYNDFIAEAVS